MELETILMIIEKHGALLFMVFYLVWEKNRFFLRVEKFLHMLTQHYFTNVKDIKNKLDNIKDYVDDK